MYEDIQNAKYWTICSEMRKYILYRYIKIYIFLIVKNDYKHMIDWLLVLNVSFNSISAISWREQILYIRHLQDAKK